MSVLVKDNFESYSLGTHPPLNGATGVDGWDIDVSQQSGTVIAFDPLFGVQSFLLGELRSTHSGPIALPVIAAAWDMWFSKNSSENFTSGSGIFAGVNNVPDTTIGPTVFNLGMCQDSRVYVDTIGGQNVDTSQTALHPETWYSIRLEATYNLYNLGDGVFRINVRVKLYIDEFLEFDTTVPTGVDVATMPQGLGISRFYISEATSGGSVIDNVQIATSTADIIIDSGGVAAAKVAQEAIELINRPPAANCIAEIAQEVIELVVLDISTPGGWKIYEA